MTKATKKMPKATVRKVGKPREDEEGAMHKTIPLRLSDALIRRVDIVKGTRGGFTSRNAIIREALDIGLKAMGVA